MSKLTAEQIVEVVSELIGYIEPYGSSQIDSERLDNQKKLEGVVDTLVWMLFVQSRNESEGIDGKRFLRR